MAISACDDGAGPALTALLDVSPSIQPVAAVQFSDTHPADTHPADFVQQLRELTVCAHPNGTSDEKQQRIAILELHESF